MNVASDPRTRFAAAADDYRRYRPGYPEQLADWIFAAAALSEPARVADVGCGTGISTRLFAARGHDVVGVDPSEEMLTRARAAGGAARYVKGEARATGLTAASVDLVTVAQAFHWFDVPPALAEFGRILVPGGWCAAFWNLRDKTPLLEAYELVLRGHCGEYESRPKADQALAQIRSRPEVVGLRETAFRNVQRLDKQGLLGRARSSSYVAHGVADLAALERDLGALFERHQQDGHVDVVYRTVAALWQIRPL